MVKSTRVYSTIMLGISNEYWEPVSSSSRKLNPTDSLPLPCGRPSHECRASSLEIHRAVKSGPVPSVAKDPKSYIKLKASTTIVNNDFGCHVTPTCRYPIPGAATLSER